MAIIFNFYSKQQGEPDFVGKLVACACDDGFVRLVALETNKQVYVGEK